MVLCITYQDFPNCSLESAVAIPRFENFALHCCEHRLVVCPEREISRKGSSPLSLVEGVYSGETEMFEPESVLAF